jgi:glycerophosphoryl diester phosphodiesterase
MKRLDPRIPTGLLVGSRNVPPDPVARVREFQADYYAPEYRLVTADLVQTLHRAGIPLVIWTVNDTAEVRRLIGLGVGSLSGDGMISDYPDRVLAVLGARR